MRIAVIGSGYVGLVSGACFSEFGVEVTCVDNDAAKIARLQRGEIPIFEPGLDQIVQSNTANGRLYFATDLGKAVEGTDAVFIAVGTPSRRGDGHADLSYVFAAAEEIAKAVKDYTVVVTKSTVPVGTGRKVAEILRKHLPESKFDVVSNPEFLREGSAIEDFMRPDRVVIGTDSERATGVMRELYRPLSLIEKPILFTSLETAELIKYAANSFLATKITFINQVADLCEKVGADVQDVARGIGLDGRIGRKFLHAGPGFGGSCFPKDCLALVKTAQESGAPLGIVETVVAANDSRKGHMAGRIIQACGGSVKGKTIAVLGLTFKPNTDDMRDSPSLAIVPALQKAGATVRAFDPEGMTEAKKLLTGITFCGGSYETMEGAHALVLVTEWNEFRALDLDRVKSLLKTPTIIDLRNIYKPADMAEAGFHYFSIGRRGAGAGAPTSPSQELSGSPSMATVRKRILVTGGAGFLGSHLCERLLADGNDVLCVDNYFTGRKDNIGHLLHQTNFEVMRHDVCFPLYVEVDEIYNLACPASPIHYQFDPVQTTKTSVIGAINMLGLAKRVKAKVFQASTSEIYGDPSVHPQTEDYRGNVNTLGPRACYDEGKRCAETLFFDYLRQHKLRIKVARIFNTYGPRMHPNDGRVVSNFIVQALKNESITVYGDGKQTRAFCYVDDLIEGFVRLMGSPENITGPINLGNPVETTVGELAEKIIAMTGSRSKIERRPLPVDDPVQRCPDIGHAKKILGWQPRVPLETGLQHTVAYFDRLLTERGENPEPTLRVVG